MTRNEPGVISDFKKALRLLAVGRQFDEFPVGAQDRHVLADDLWTTYDHFAIVESKWSERETSDELRNKKVRVKALCDELQKDPRMAMIHGSCHRIAWRDSQSGRLMSQEYRKAVCGKYFPQTCIGLNCDEGAIAIEDFADGFFGEPPSHCVPAADFQDYVKWLTKVVSGKERTVLVLALRSDALGNWVSDHVTLKTLCDLLPKKAASKRASP